MVDLIVNKKNINQFIVKSLEDDCQSDIYLYI